jgi:type IV pilus assembly protein PilF
MKLIILLATLISLFTLSACGGASNSKSDNNKRQSAELNVQLASGYIQRGQLKVAYEKLRKAIELDDEYVYAYTTMAVLKDMLGEFDEAENYYLEALDIEPKNSQLLNNYGTFLCKMDDVIKLEEAIEQFNKALRNQFYTTPQIAQANLGYCLMKNEKFYNYQKAETHLRKALKINPHMKTALIAMGELGIKTQRYLMARAYMQRYHAAATATAQSLWLQIQAENALGDQQYFIKLSRQLLDKFPRSVEAKDLMELSDK